MICNRAAMLRLRTAAPMQPLGLRAIDIPGVTVGLGPTYRGYAQAMAAALRTHGTAEGREPAFLPEGGGDDDREITWGDPASTMPR
jgi:hypothetical protein